MSAILAASDGFKMKDGVTSLNDSQINSGSSSPVNWEEKYNEVYAMLKETKGELDDFHESSKQLEEELVQELERTEKAQHDLKVKIARAENERDEWKSKFMSLQTTHNKTTTSLQRELDMLRREHEQVRVQLRDLEMGNDDLERNERAISSSLADSEARMNRILEEKILLEQELLIRASAQEECQRLRDELRDANEEVNVVREQLANAQSRASPIASTPPSSAPPSEEHLPRTPPPGETVEDVNSPRAPASRPSRQASPTGKSARPQRAGLHQPRGSISTPPTSKMKSSVSRTNGTSSIATPPRTTTRTTPRSGTTPRTPSNSTMPSTAGGTPRSKGVQMVSDMRARVTTLQTKMKTRVPRLTMGSVSKQETVYRNAPSPSKRASPSSPTPGLGPQTPISLNSTSTMRKDATRRGAAGVDISDGEKERQRRVSLQYPSPAASRYQQTERTRKTSSTQLSSPSSYRPLASTSGTSDTTTHAGSQRRSLSKSIDTTPTKGGSTATIKSGPVTPSASVRRARMSVSNAPDAEGRTSTGTMGSTSTASSRSIATPPQPSTPTKVARPGTYGSFYQLSSTHGPKRPSVDYGPGHAKHLSLSTSGNRSPSQDYYEKLNMTARPGSNTSMSSGHSSDSRESAGSPQRTVRLPSRLPSSRLSASTAHSMIKPPGHTTAGRKSMASSELTDAMLEPDATGRSRLRASTTKSTLNRSRYT